MTEGGDGKSKRGSISGYFDRFSRFVDDNKRIIVYALYGVSAVGGLLVLRSLRVFKQFKSVKDIPEEFIENKHQIFGYVERSEILAKSDNIVPRISISHIPIYGKFRRNENYEIPVVISGVRLHTGFSLLARQTLKEMTENKKVKVTIFGASQEGLEGRVCLKRFGLWGQCVGGALVQQGYAEILKNTLIKTDNKVLLKYRNNLENKEAFAKRKKIGLWKVESDEDRKSFVQKLLRYLKFK